MTHSPQQNKKAMLTRAAYFKVSTPIKLEKKNQALFTFVYRKGRFWYKTEKGEHHHWILHIWFSLGTKFQLKLTTLIFWTKVAQKGYFRSKTEKVDSAIEFYVFELVKVPDSNLNWQFWFFGPSLPKRGNSSQKITIEFCIKKWKSPLSSAYSN